MHVRVLGTHYAKSLARFFLRIVGDTVRVLLICAVVAFSDFRHAILVRTVLSRLI